MSLNLMLLSNEPELGNKFSGRSTPELRLMLSDYKATKNGVPDNTLKEIEEELFKRTKEAQKRQEQLDEEQGIIHIKQTPIVEQPKLTTSLTKPKKYNAITQLAKEFQKNKQIASKIGAWLVFQDRTNKGPVFVGMYQTEAQAIAACRKKTHFYFEQAINKAAQRAVKKIYPKIKKVK